MNRMTWLVRRCCASGLAALALCPVSAFAQDVVFPATASLQLGFGDRASNIALNAAIGGVIATAHALIVRRSVVDALKAGLAGGATTGAGKQFAAASWNGSALVGRSVSQLGISIESAARTDTIRYALPVGPFTLEWSPSEEQHFRTYVDVAEVLFTAYAVTRPHTRLDLAASLATSTTVLRRPHIDTDGHDGETGEGVIVMGDTLSNERGFLTLRHERVHVLQDDELEGMIGHPIEDWLASRLHGTPLTLGGGAFSLTVRLGLVSPLIGSVANEAIPYYRRPWEQEAYHLTEGPNWRSNYAATRQCTVCP